MPFLGKTPQQFVDPEVDIDGGSIDGTAIGATSASTATVTTFTSTGIDDNATSTAITIDSSNHVSTAKNITAGGNLVVGSDGSVTGSEGGQIDIRGNDGTATQMYLDVAGPVNRMFTTSDNVDFYIGQLAGTGGAIRLYTNAAERARIDSSGNLLVGTTSATGFSGKVVITDGAVGGTTYLDICNGSNDNQFLKLGIANNLGIIGYDNNDGLAFGRLNSAADVGFSNESMRLDASGNLLVGTTSTPTTLVSVSSGNGIGLNNPSGNQSYIAVARQSDYAQAYLNSTATGTANSCDFISVAKQGTYVGALAYDGADVYVKQISDQRLKTNITDSESALPLINAMQVRSFDWVNNIKKSKRFGFVAQELNQAFSDAVAEGGDDENENPWTVSEAKLIPVLTKAIQEQQAIIEDLQTRLSALEAN